MSQPTASTYRITLADERKDALQRVSAVLESLGHEVAGLALSVAEAMEEVAGTDPELAMVVVHDDDEHALDLVQELAESLDGPVLVLLDPADAAFLAKAADRGLSAFASSFEAEELQGAIEVAVRLHEQRQTLTTQVETLTTALERRAVIERAKGVLMERYGVGERAAFVRLQDDAAERGRRVSDFAAELAGGPRPAR
ncbi:MAG: ANTAR domain-containing protein [Solirubrobacteraceae bacterium]|nr:ANTAR domain-containing protein [Solirubrobacteraceae bacterium]